VSLYNPPISHHGRTSGSRARYFASRPDLLTRMGATEGPATTTERVETQSTLPTAAIATAAQHALANPTATRALAGGLLRAGNSMSGNATSNAPNADHASPAVSVGRVAAAAQAFSAVAPSPPKHAPAPAHKRTDPSGLAAQKVRIATPPRCVFRLSCAKC
jgi:hypothetical protein